MTPLINIRAEMKRLSLDALLVTDEKNQQYLSGFAFTDGYLLILADVAYLVTDFRYKEAAERHAYEGYTVVLPEGRISFMQEIIAEKKVRRLGFEGVGTDGPGGIFGEGGDGHGVEQSSGGLTFHPFQKEVVVVAEHHEGHVS